MKESNWFIYLIICIFLGLLVPVSVNFYVDIDKDFRLNSLSSRQLYSELKKHNDKGLGWNGSSRPFAESVIQNFEKADCLILGSSHTQEINKSISYFSDCESLINISMEGLYAEDLLAFSYYLYQNKKLPRKLFIEFTFYNLDWNKKSLISTNNKMLKNVLDSSYFTDHPYQSSFQNLLTGFDKFKKLIHKDVFIRSLKFFFAKEVQKKKQTKSLKFLDGSTKFVHRSTSEIVPRMHPFKAGGNTQFNEQFAKQLANYLNFISENAELTLLAFPLHKDSYGFKESDELFNRVENYFTSLGLRFHGTYLNKNFNCPNTWFYDYYHPTLNCINKILSSYKN